MRKLINGYLYLIVFFIYSGFHAIIALTINALGDEASRLVSVPIRLVTTLGMIMVMLYWGFHRERVLKKNIYYLLFICFWTIYLVKIMFHHSSGYPLRLGWSEYVFYALNFSVLPFLMFSFIPFATYKKTILNALIFSGFSMGVTTTFLYRNVIGSGIGRISMAKYVDSNLVTLSPLSLSYASVLTVMLCVYQLLYKKDKTKWYTIYIYLTIAVSFVMFLMGASRGSVLALAVSLLYFVYTAPFRVKLKSYVLIGLSIPLLIWGIAKTGSAVFSRSSGALESGDTGRESLWANAWNEFSTFPVFGRRIEIGFYPHNFILEIMMAMGILGLLIFIPLFFKGLQKTISLPKTNRDYIWVSMIFLQGVCQHLFSASLYTAVLLFFPLGILFQSEISGCRNIDKQDEFLI